MPADLLTDPQAEAVVVATRHDTHADYVLRALAAGKRSTGPSPWSALPGTRHGSAPSRQPPGAENHAGRDRSGLEEAVARGGQG